MAKDWLGSVSVGSCTELMLNYLTIQQVVKPTPDQVAIKWILQGSFNK